MGQPAANPSCLQQRGRLRPAPHDRPGVRSTWDPLVAGSLFLPGPPLSHQVGETTVLPAFLPTSELCGLHHRFQHISHQCCFPKTKHRVSGNTE